MNGEIKWVGMAQLSMKILLAKISCGARYLRRYVPEGLAGGKCVSVAGPVPNARHVTDLAADRHSVNWSQVGASGRVGGLPADIRDCGGT